MAGRITVYYRGAGEDHLDRGIFHLPSIKGPDGYQRDGGHAFLRIDDLTTGQTAYLDGGERQGSNGAFEWWPNPNQERLDEHHDISWEVPSPVAQQAIAEIHAIKDASSTGYDLMHNNCAEMVLHVLNDAGYRIEVNTISMHLRGAVMPGDMGSAIAQALQAQGVAFQTDVDYPTTLTHVETDVGANEDPRLLDPHAAHGANQALPDHLGQVLPEHVGQPEPGHLGPLDATQMPPDTGHTTPDHTTPLDTTQMPPDTGHTTPDHTTPLDTTQMPPDAGHTTPDHPEQAVPDTGQVGPDAAQFPLDPGQTPPDALDPAQLFADTAQPLPDVGQVTPIPDGGPDHTGQVVPDPTGLTTTPDPGAQATLEPGAQAMPEPGGQATADHNLDLGLTPGAASDPSHELALPLHPGAAEPSTEPNRAGTEPLDQYYNLATNEGHQAGAEGGAIQGEGSINAHGDDGAGGEAPPPPS